MGMRDYKRTAAHKAEQKARTMKNKEAKYLKLIENHPNDPHNRIWQSRVT